VLSGWTIFLLTLCALAPYVLALALLIVLGILVWVVWKKLHVPHSSNGDGRT